jgi:hypothetical protein
MRAQTQEVEPEDGGEFSLPEIHAMVGGHFEVVHPRPGRFHTLGERRWMIDIKSGDLLLVSDEGKLRAMAYNV